jgi:phosphotransferase system  glucose/maltose/N-acetylglucosamine-specific IIC component
LQSQTILAIDDFLYTALLIGYALCFIVMIVLFVLHQRERWQDRKREEQERQQQKL